MITETTTPPRAPRKCVSAHIIGELPEENVLAIVPWSPGCVFAHIIGEFLKKKMI